MPNWDLYNARDDEVNDYLAQMTGQSPGVQCGDMVVNINTGQIGWVVWPEPDSVTVEISFGTGRKDWAVDQWSYADIVIPGSFADTSRAAPVRQSRRTRPGGPDRPLSSAAPVVLESGHPGTRFPVPPDRGPAVPGSGLPSKEGRS